MTKLPGYLQAQLDFALKDYAKKYGQFALTQSLSRIPAAALPGQSVGNVIMPKYSTVVGKNVSKEFFVVQGADDIVVSAASKWRLHGIENSLESYVAPGDSKFVDEDETILITNPRWQHHFVASDIFYVGLVLAARQSGGAAFPADQEHSNSVTASQEELLDAIFGSDHDFLIWKNPIAAKLSAGGLYQANMTVSLKKFFNTIQEERASALTDMIKDYKVYVYVYSIAAQTIEWRGWLSFIGKTDENRINLL